MRHLAGYLELLHREQDLHRVDAGLDPSWEVATLAEVARNRQSPALLLTGVAEAEMPLAVNLFATSGRLKQLCAGRSAEELAENIDQFASDQSAGLGWLGWLQRMATAKTDAEGRRFLPRQVKTGECQQIVRLGRDVDLRALPWIGLPGHGPAGGRWFPAAEAHFLDPIDHRPRVESAILYFDLDGVTSDRLWIVARETESLAQLFATVQNASDGAVPLALTLGGDPAGYVAATAPLPCDLDRMVLAGLLRDQGREMVKARSCPLLVPADADIVLEGQLEPTRPPWHGEKPLCPNAFGHPGPPLDRLSLRTLRVTAVTHRANPVVSTIVPGNTPNDWTRIRRAMLVSLLPLLRRQIPELVDADFPEASAARHVAILAIRKHYGGQARQVAQALWSTPLGRFVKTILLVDDTVDTRDTAQWNAELTRHVDWRHDLITHAGPTDPEDPTVDLNGLTTRLAIDATTKRKGDSHYSDCLSRSDDLCRRVAERWEEWGLAGPSHES